MYDFSMKLSFSFLCFISYSSFIHGFLSSPKCAEYPERNCKMFFQGSAQIHQNFRRFKTPDFIKYYGYPVEEHKITTDDKYILTYFRIPAKTPNAIPVLLMHGILTSSVQWFLQPPHKSLAFMLHDAGYDVWFGNSRGTSYSQEHERLNPLMDLEYWNFSSYEMGKYDLPSAVDYILASSIHSSIYYIGHSLGGQNFFIAASLNSDFNKKIRTAFALGPAVYTGNTTNRYMNAAASVAAPYLNYKILNLIGRGQYTPRMRKQLNRFSEVCRHSVMNCLFCARAMDSLVGSNPCQSAIPIIATHLPESTSAKVFSHGAQAIASGHFREYDYGRWRNLQTYGRLQPPEYSWSNVNISTVLFWGQNDNLVVPKDIAKTIAALGTNVKENIEVPDPKWTHLDFLFGMDADVLVYSKILNIMNNRKYG